MRVCTTLTIGEIVQRLACVPGDLSVPVTIQELADRTDIPLEQLRYLRRRALLQDDIRDPFVYCPGAKHRVRVSVLELIDYLEKKYGEGKEIP